MGDGQEAMGERRWAMDHGLEVSGKWLEAMWPLHPIAYRRPLNPAPYCPLPIAHSRPLNPAD